MMFLEEQPKLSTISNQSVSVSGGPLSKVLASLGENLNRYKYFYHAQIISNPYRSFLLRNYFWVNRAYKMSRLNSDNKLKFGKKRSALKKKKRNPVLSPLNFTKQVLIRPQMNLCDQNCDFITEVLL